MNSILSRSTKLSGFLTNLPSVFIASQTKLSIVATLILVMGSSWVLGQLVWQFEKSNNTFVSWTPTHSNTPSSTTESSDITGLLKANLFGLYSKKVIAKPKPKPVVQDAPKTKLNLVLVGAVSSPDEKNSLAVIANRGRQSTYGLGELIEGTQAKLKAVFVDRVIIDNSGRDETLMLEGVEYKKRQLVATQQTTNSRSRGVGNNPAPVSDLSEVREQILNEPRSILRYIGLSPEKVDGRLVGYRLRPGSKRALFDSVGLLEGDVATRINGEDLTNPAAMGKIWQSINDLTELSLTIKRDGQSQDIYIRF